VDDDGRNSLRRSSAERAEILRFQLTRLQEGQAAPEITATDLHQQPIRLSQFRGKVVLLTFSMGNLENELYAACARLQKQFGNESFQCISVISSEGSGGYSVRQIVEAGQITWPIMRDSEAMDLARHWCQETFPECYVIDQQGIIRGHAFSRS